MSRYTCDELEMVIADKAADDPHYAIAYSLARVAHEIHQATWTLGMKDATTPLGAIEMVAKELKEISIALHAIATKDD